MMRREKRRAWGMGVGLSIAILVGLAVVLLLAPGSGADTQPPQCWGMLGYRVPCGMGLSLTAGITTAGILALAFWLVRRRRSVDS